MTLPFSAHDVIEPIIYYHANLYSVDNTDSLVDFLTRLGRR